MRKPSPAIGPVDGAFVINSNCRFNLTTITNHFTIPFSLARRGASSGDGPVRRSRAWRPAAAARNRGLGRHGDPPAGHYDPAARSLAQRASEDNAGDGSAGPGAE